MTSSAPPPEAKITRDIEEFKVRGNSESAIVSYRLIEHVEIGDQQTGGQCLYTDTFVRREGRWQLLASQATRIESEPKIANIAPSVYDAYVGHYALTPSLIFTVTREGDKLIGQAPDGSRVELLPENETTFFVRGRAGRTIFVKDDRGQVTHMIIKSEGDGTRMKKID